MAFVKYTCGAWKKEIRNLLRKRLALKDKIRYHLGKIKSIKTYTLPKVEKDLQMYLDRAEETK